MDSKALQRTRGRKRVCLYVYAIVEEQSSSSDKTG